MRNISLSYSFLTYWYIYPQVTSACYTDVWKFLLLCNTHHVCVMLVPTSYRVAGTFLSALSNWSGSGQ